MARLISMNCWAVIFGLVLVACTFSVDYTGGRYKCVLVGDCPPNYLCSGGVCTKKSGESGTCNQDGGGGCTELSPDAPKTVCSGHDKCSLTQSCRPDLDGTGRYCVPRCDVVAQKDCAAGQSCVLWEGRGYCREKRGGKQEGQLCSGELDCELHLYCRPVQKFPHIRRCAGPCDKRQGCSKPAQNCLSLRPEDEPIGYCEPIPTEVKDGEICAGDLICQKGFTCTRESDGVSRCRPIPP